MVLEGLIIVMPHGMIIGFSFQTRKLNSEVSVHIRSINVNKPCYFPTWKMCVSGLSWHSLARTHRLEAGNVVYSSSVRPQTLLNCHLWQSFTWWPRLPVVTKQTACTVLLLCVDMCPETSHVSVSQIDIWNFVLLYITFPSKPSFSLLYFQIAVKPLLF